MQLRYDDSLSRSTEALVLCRAEQRIEMHLRRGEGSVTLLAFAGTARHGPQRNTCQGPYETMEQAIAARSAIVAHLLQAEGYRLLEHAQALWSLPAQRLIKTQRARQQAWREAYAFKPEDVFLDW